MDLSTSKVNAKNYFSALIIILEPRLHISVYFFNPISPQQWQTKKACKNTHKVHPRDVHVNGNVNRRVLICDGSHRGIIIAEQVPLEPQPRRFGRDEVAVEASATAQSQESQNNQRHRDLQPHVAANFSSFFLWTTKSENRTRRDRASDATSVRVLERDDGLWNSTRGAVKMWVRKSDAFRVYSAVYSADGLARYVLSLL